MKFSTLIVIIFAALFLTCQTVEAKKPKKGVSYTSSLYLYINYEVVGAEVKYMRHGVSVNIGMSPLFQSSELEVFNVRRGEAISFDYHHYLVDSDERGIYAGAGFFIRGNLFGQNTDIQEELRSGDSSSTQREVTVPVYAIVGEKIAIGQYGFMDMHVRINEKISPSIFFGLRF